MNSTENKNILFPPRENAPIDYFTGAVRIKTLVPNDSILNTQVANVVFEAGARNNWHTHPGGQILIAIDGVGYYQEKGKAIQLLHKGDIVNILPNIVHWHGASAESDFTHITINPNTQNGIVEWLDRVSDHEYNSIK